MPESTVATDLTCVAEKFTALTLQLSSLTPSALISPAVLQPTTAAPGNACLTASMNGASVRNDTAPKIVTSCGSIAASGCRCWAASCLVLSSTCLIFTIAPAWVVEPVGPGPQHCARNAGRR